MKEIQNDINAQLDLINKAAQLQKKQVEFLIVAAGAAEKADMLNKTIDMASDLGLSQADADGILTKAVGLNTLDTATVAIGFRVAGMRALKSARAIDGEITSLMKLIEAD